MHCHCGTNNRAPRWTFTDPCKPEVRPGAREESASPAWLAAPAMNARDTKVYIWRLDTGCGPTLYRKCHSHNTPGKGHKEITSGSRIIKKTMDAVNFHISHEAFSALISFVREFNGSTYLISFDQYAIIKGTTFI